jgi:hypothetical protein
MDVFRSGDVWHDDGLPGDLHVYFVAGDWLRLGVNSHAICSYEITGTLPDRLEIVVDWQDRDGVAVPIDAQSYGSGGTYQVADRAYNLPVSSGQHSLTLRLSPWMIWRLRARRVGGDATTQLRVTATTSAPDT